jgi:nicotinamidase-related amidase
MVRNAGIATMIFTGIATELGVESSARDALNRDFYPVIVSDEVSSSDNDAHIHPFFAELSKIFFITSTNELGHMVSR